MLVPQHMLVNGVPQHYNQYKYQKEHYIGTHKESLLAKLEPEMQLVEKDAE